MQGISPLFRIPSCVLFSEKANGKRKLPESGLQGLSLSGNLPTHNCNYDTAKPKITEKELICFYAKQGKSAAFSTNKQKNRMQETHIKASLNKEQLFSNNPLAPIYQENTGFFLKIHFYFFPFQNSCRFYKLGTGGQIIGNAKLSI